MKDEAATPFFIEDSKCIGFEAIAIVVLIFAIAFGWLFSSKCKADIRAAAANERNAAALERIADKVAPR